LPRCPLPAAPRREIRNCLQVGDARRGAGPSLAEAGIRWVVPSPTRDPRPSNSPRIRRLGLAVGGVYVVVRWRVLVVGGGELVVGRRLVVVVIGGGLGAALGAGGAALGYPGGLVG
jgi:hypothetical protein